MATTQIVPFCTTAAGSGGNRLTPSAYAALTVLLAEGFQSGTAASNQVNTALAQATFMAAGLAGFCVAQGVSVPDDGNLGNLVTEIGEAVAAAAVAAVSAVPTGTPFMFAGSTAPAGSLPANGAAVSRTTYANLFAVVGTTYGVGDGSTTFNVPDDRAIFYRGVDNSAGIDPSRVLGSTQAHAFQDHAHTYAMQQSGSDGGSITAASNGRNSSGETDTASATGGYNTAGETRPYNRAYLACIKY